MDEREIRRELENKLALDDVLFEQLMDSIKTKDPRLSVKELLMQHRGKPYFQDMLGKAKVMLELQRYSDLKFGRNLEYWSK